MEQPIVILDSGVGGLTVTREVMRQLPHERIIYFGDNARAPYGSLAPEEISKFIREIVNYLGQFQPKIIVIACNTATAFALDEIRAMVNIPVLGVIKPGARAAIEQTLNGYIGVIGTEGTINSGAYENALKELSPSVNVISRACPLFVPLVEKGNFQSYESYETIYRSIVHLRQYPIDCLILGCTHYPFLADMIQQVVGPGVRLISSADETARELSAILHQEGKLALGNSLQVHQFLCSGDLLLFKSITQQWLGRKVKMTPVVWQVPQIV